MSSTRKSTWQQSTCLISIGMLGEENSFFLSLFTSVGSHEKKTSTCLRDGMQNSLFMHPQKRTNHRKSWVISLQHFLGHFLKYRIAHETSRVCYLKYSPRHQCVIIASNLAGRSMGKIIFNAERWIRPNIPVFLLPESYADPTGS